MITIISALHMCVSEPELNLTQPVFACGFCGRTTAVTILLVQLATEPNWIGSN